MYQTLAAAVAVFFLADFLKGEDPPPSQVLHPCAGHRRTIFSIVNCILYTEGIWNYSQDTVMQNWCMMLFLLTSIGYMASLRPTPGGGYLVFKMGIMVAILSSSY